MAEPVVFKDALVQTSTASGATVFTKLEGVKSVTLPLSKAELANSVMSDDLETFFPGLISAPISVVCRNDFTTAAAGIDLFTWTRWNSETKFQLQIAPVNSTILVTNPAYTFDRVGILSHTPISGSHGQLLENTIEFRCLSGCSVTRETSSST